MGRRAGSHAADDVAHTAAGEVRQRERATAIARRLASCGDLPALLLLFQREAERAGHQAAAQALADALEVRFPAFRHQRTRLPIDQTLLERIGLDETVTGLTLHFHPGGHLARASANGSDGPTLTLDATPGSGRFQHTGSRGGSGFHTDERTEHGAVHTTFFSPWHDGEASQAQMDWVCWALECAASVLTEAQRGPREKRAKRGKRR